jgi:hypothetical protein
MAGGELVTLAEAAGQAVVTAAATDAWGTVKAGVTRLLGRGDQDNAAVAARRLEDTRSQLAAGAGPELAAVVELRALLADIQAALPAGAVTAAGHAVAAGRDLSITASGGGVAAGTVHGDVSPPGPPGPGPAA